MNISKKYVYSKFLVIYHNVSFDRTIDRMCYKTTFLLCVITDNFLEARNLHLYIDWYVHKLCVQNKYSS
jgi:hypothetical protein